MLLLRYYATRCGVARTQRIRCKQTLSYLRTAWSPPFWSERKYETNFN